MEIEIIVLPEIIVVKFNYIATGDFMTDDEIINNVSVFQYIFKCFVAVPRCNLCRL